MFLDILYCCGEFVGCKFGLRVADVGRGGWHSWCVAGRWEFLGWFSLLICGICECRVGGFGWVVLGGFRRFVGGGCAFDGLYPCLLWGGFSWCFRFCGVIRRCWGWAVRCFVCLICVRGGFVILLGCSWCVLLWGGFSWCLCFLAGAPRLPVV